MKDDDYIIFANKTDEKPAYEASYEYRFRILTDREVTRELMRIERQSKNPPPCFGLRPDWYI